MPSHPLAPAQQAGTSRSRTPSYGSRGIRAEVVVAAALAGRHAPGIAADQAPDLCAAHVALALGPDRDLAHGPADLTVYDPAARGARLRVRGDQQHRHRQYARDHPRRRVDALPPVLDARSDRTAGRSPQAVRASRSAEGRTARTC